MQKDFYRKGAKRCRVSKGFLCAFAGEILTVIILNRAADEVEAHVLSGKVVLGPGFPVAKSRAIAELCATFVSSMSLW